MTGGPRRSWLPLAALGFALLVMVAVELPPRTTPVEGTGYPPDGELHAVAISVGGAGSVAPATLGWPVALACVVLAVAGWYWSGLRRAGTPPRTGRFLLGTCGALLAVPVLDLGGLLQLRLDGDVRGPLIATLGLLLLAGYERSRFLAAVAVLFPLVTVVFLPPVAGALVAAGLLFAAAFGVLLRPRPDGADTP
ncbi:hypothetical protein M8542_28555 [Amycolatopsis sp. OK19-0408]|uniref:Uncharacterized protein n=1 Tax=Amycolatopsis iheyensis TaxID=2945988 RepID=A0A9X2NGC3_9PSEU|nr:hypothetical protein [Amycolatopsis iheyensis]MCR6486786.1 hypothetical protein [Amycolatopsis iheyensis]